MELRKLNRFDLLKTLTIHFVLKQKERFTVDEIKRNVRASMIRYGYPYELTYNQEIIATVKTLVFANIIRLNHDGSYSLIDID